jgi:hypothetical protein
VPLLALLLSVALIGVLTLTPAGQMVAAADGLSVWQRVSCVTCPATWLADIVSNLVLFAPFGAALVLVGMSVRRAIIVAAAASLVIELLQLSGFPSGRAPAMADLISNALGAAIGAVCARRRATLLSPAPATARMLRAGWIVACGLMLFGSATAMSPAMPVQTDRSVTASPLPFTPGYGWFAAAAREARINGVAVAHGGSGPVIVAAPRMARIEATVTVQGQDERRHVVPIVFVHDPSMVTVDPTVTRAHLLLAQVGPDVSLSSYLLATRWGLCTPSLVSAGAFSRGGNGSVQLHGSVASDVWSVQWFNTASPASVHATMLRLSPALGWTLLQTVVPAGAVSAPMLSLLWLTLWFAPLGYWMPLRTPTRLARVLGEVVVVTIVLLGLGIGAAHNAGTAPLSLLASAWCLLTSAAGALARVAMRHGGQPLA